jgi:hypothetical protein
MFGTLLPKGQKWPVSWIRPGLEALLFRFGGDWRNVLFFADNGLRSDLKLEISPRWRPHPENGHSAYGPCSYRNFRHPRENL